MITLKERFYHFLKDQRVNNAENLANSLALLVEAHQQELMFKYLNYQPTEDLGEGIWN